MLSEKIFPFEKIQEKENKEHVDKIERLVQDSTEESNSG
jgi:hypothetical protein